MDDLPADVPKTDRELLLQLNMKIDNMLEKMQGQDGKGGICEEIAKHGIRIQNLENWRWYAVGMATLATFGIITFGKYI